MAWGCAYSMGCYNGRSTGADTIFLQYSRFLISRHINPVLRVLWTTEVPWQGYTRCYSKRTVACFFSLIPIFSENRVGVPGTSLCNYASSMLPYRYSLYSIVLTVSLPSHCVSYHVWQYRTACKKHRARNSSYNTSVFPPLLIGPLPVEGWF